MAYNPRIEKWELYFEGENGYDNRFNIMKAFTEFWESPKLGKLEMPGKCMLGGQVFGRKGFEDGAEIFTSDIQSVERLEHDRFSGAPHDLMCATTVSGSKYYFYSDDHNAYMALMLGDIIHMGQLDQRRYYYLVPEYRGSQLI